MKTKVVDYEVPVPNRDGGEVAEKVKVQIAIRWDGEIQQWLLTPQAHRIINDTKSRHMALLKTLGLWK